MVRVWWAESRLTIARMAARRARGNPWSTPWCEVAMTGLAVSVNLPGRGILQP